MSIRNDLHSPTSFRPEDYVYLGAFDNWPTHGSFLGNRASYDTPFGEVDAYSWSHACYVGGRRLLEEEGCKVNFKDGNSQCDHCGARIRYVAVYLHNLTNEAVAVGSTCAEERFGCDTRRDYDMKKLRETAALKRYEDVKVARAAKFVAANCPELESWILDAKIASGVSSIFADIAGKLIQYGSLTEKQISFMHRLLREYMERQRNGGKTDRELVWEAEKAKAEDVPEGRLKISGKVVKTEWRESQYGNTLKMILKDHRGFVVWMSVPSSCINEIARDQEWEFTVTLTRSGRDPKFGLGSRPSQPRMLSAPAVT